MVSTDLERLLDSDLSDRINRLVLADILEDDGDDDASEMLRTLDDWLYPVRHARNLLRDPGLVEPQCLRIHLDGSWHWCLFRALPGHPRPGNAGGGYTHSAEFSSGSTGGKSDWLARLVERAGRDRGQTMRQKCAGTWAALNAVMQSLDLPQANGSSAGGELVILDLER